jgi:hypothetical protein
LNQRLENGQPAGAILPSLNALPEVQAMLADRFAASPVNQQRSSKTSLNKVFQAKSRLKRPAKPKFNNGPGRPQCSTTS